jgi:hypothetical protein
MPAFFVGFRRAWPGATDDRVAPGHARRTQPLAYSERFNPVCRPTVGTYPLHHQPLAYSERLMVKLPNTGASRWPLNSRVLW